MTVVRETTIYINKNSHVSKEIYTGLYFDSKAFYCYLLPENPNTLTVIQ